MRACPICHASTEEANHDPNPPKNPHVPFCSERCKLIDLGNWLGDGYRIADSGSAASGSDGRSS